MAFDPTVPVADWRKRVKITIGATIYRYADQYLTMDDDTVWDGYILAMSPLKLSAGGLLDPRIVRPSMEVTLGNADDVVRQRTDDAEHANADVEISLGQGEVEADYQTIFCGVIRAPGGIAYWDDQVLRMLFDDARSKDAKVLPVNRYDPATLTNMETKSEFKVKPLVYGSWLSTDASGERVPGVQTDSTAGTGGKFSFADHALKSIEKVFNNTTDITANCTLDAANAEITITSGTYTPATDTVSINCEGATDDGLTTGTLLISLPDQLEDLLKTHLSVVAGEIDSTAFSDWETELTTNDSGRNWIGTEQSSDDIIRDILVSGFADIAIKGGKYFPVYRVIDVASGAPTYYDFNIRERSDTSKAFSVQRDPERLYANEVVVDYSYDPTNAKWTKTYTKQNATAITIFGSTKRRRLQLKWLYNANGSEHRADQELFLFSQELEVTQTDFDPNALTKVPTDQYKLTYSKFTDTPFQVREASLVFDVMKAAFTSWNMSSLAPGRWMGTAAPTWALSTGQERAEQGYWCDSAGRADPADANSAVSIWF